MDDLQTAAHRYFRDTAELPMVQTTTFSVTDHSGRVQKPKTNVTTYVFHGYSKARETASGTIAGHESLWAMLHGSKMMKLSMNGAMWTIIPGMRLYGDAYSVQIDRSGNSNGLVTAQFTPIKPCPAFAMTKFSQYYLPDHSCGPSEFQLGKDLTFQKFSSDIPGLPAPVKLDPFGLCTLRTYHTEIAFQSVNLPGESDPFLVPKEATSTLETDKGTIVISSSYQPKQVAGK